MPEKGHRLSSGGEPSFWPGSNRGPASASYISFFSVDPLQSMGWENEAVTSEPGPMPQRLWQSLVSVRTTLLWQATGGLRQGCFLTRQTCNLSSSWVLPLETRGWNGWWLYLQA